VEAAAGEILVEEGTPGDCMYFIVEGKVRIEKRIAGEAGEMRTKELAMLVAGDFFGEMALVESQVRSARVVAATDVVLLKLGREELFGWLEREPRMTGEFFKTLLRTLSKRLRTTSRELTLLYDLANLFLQPGLSEQAVVVQVVDDLGYYLEGTWSVAGYLYNEFNQDYELAGAQGPEAEALRTRPVWGAASQPVWRDERTLEVPLPGEKRDMGLLLLAATEPLEAREKEEISRVVETVARLLVSALLNIRHAEEEKLKARLKARMI